MYESILSVANEVVFTPEGATSLSFQIVNIRTGVHSNIPNIGQAEVKIEERDNGAWILAKYARLQQSESGGTYTFIAHYEPLIQGKVYRYLIVPFTVDYQEKKYYTDPKQAKRKFTQI